MLRQPTATARQFSPPPGAKYKLVYLARRNPALKAEEFPQAWREHSQLASSFATSLGKHFLSSHQCVKDRADGIDASFENDYDGSTILGMKSWEDLLAARYHPHSLDELQKDEERVFAGAVDDWTMAVEENVVVDGQAGGYVLLAFLTPLNATDFAAASFDAIGKLVESAPDATRIVWNLVVDQASAYPFAAIAECWFSSRDEALRAAADTGIVAALEQPGIADRAKSARLFARINLAKATTGMDRNTRWDEG